MYYDWTYVILVLPAVLLSMLASHLVNSTFDKFCLIKNINYISGAEAAAKLLRAYGLDGVSVEHVSGQLNDFYDPKTNRVHLSDCVYNSCSVAAVGVACHEVGHAMQYADGYFPAKIRTAIVPVTNFGSKLSMPLIIGGVILGSFVPLLFNLVYVGIGCFALCALFQLITLPVEFNASRRAVKAIVDCDILKEEEMPGAKKVLRAAALTYVAALAVSLMQFLRFLILYCVGGRRRN